MSRHHLAYSVQYKKKSYITSIHGFPFKQPTNFKQFIKFTSDVVMETEHTNWSVTGQQTKESA